MKLQSGFVYIENCTAVVNAEKKPEKDKFRYSKNTPMSRKGIMEYLKIILAWNDSCMEVENVGILHSNMLLTNRRHTPIKWFRAGSPVHFLPAGEGTCRITEII